MRKSPAWTRALWSALVVAAALSADLVQGQPPPSSADAPVQSRHSAQRVRSQILVDGQPTPLFWAVGLSDPQEIGAYASVGFNTVEIAVRAPSAETWKTAADLAQAAAARGMYVLLTVLAPKDLVAGHPGSFRVSAFDDAYRAAVAGYLDPIIARGMDLPGVVGWVVEGVDAEALRYTQTDFAQYLLQWYGSASEVSRAWGADLGDLTGVTETLVAQLDARKELGVGRASVDLARFRCRVYSDLLDIWAQEIRRFDPTHVVFAGRQRSYRAAISVPGSCDGMLLGLYPGVAEDDPQTHNVHGVDIARRANQFAALPVLKVSAAASGAQVASWIAQAVMHGAAGAGLADWSDIRAKENLRSEVREALLVTRELKLCPRVVWATAAMLYEPFAAGGYSAGRPLYGWITGASIHEPGRLFTAFSRGTICGPLDYLSQDGLETATLGHYGVIIAPLALSLTPPQQAAIAGYVERGGTFVADLGIGSAETGNLGALPSTLAQVFGVSLAPDSAQHPVNFMAMSPPARFPSLTRQMGTVSPPHAATFDPPVYLASLAPTALPVLVEWDRIPAVTGVVAQPYGAGWGVFGTTRLWQNWLPGNSAFDAFHRDLLAFTSPIALRQASGAVAEDDMTLFEDGSIMLLKRGSGVGQVALRNPKGSLYRIWGGMQEIEPVSASVNCVLLFGRGGLEVAEPLPIELTARGGRVLVQVVAYAADGVSLGVYGPASRIVPKAGVGLGVVPAGQASAHIRISAGAYALAQGSRHEVRVTPVGGERGSVREVTVRRDGILSFNAPANTTIAIRPLGSGAGRPAGGMPRKAQ